EAVEDGAVAGEGPVATTVLHVPDYRQPRRALPSYIIARDLVGGRADRQQPVVRLDDHTPHVRVLVEPLEDAAAAAERRVEGAVCQEAAHGESGATVLLSLGGASSVEGAVGEHRQRGGVSEGRARKRDAN